MMTCVFQSTKWLLQVVTILKNGNCSLQKLTNFLMRLGNGRAELHSPDDAHDTGRKCTNLTRSPCSLQPGVLQDS